MSSQTASSASVTTAFSPTVTVLIIWPAAANSSPCLSRFHSLAAITENVASNSAVSIHYCAHSANVERWCELASYPPSMISQRLIAHEHETSSVVYLFVEAIAPATNTRVFHPHISRNNSDSMPAPQPSHTPHSTKKPRPPRSILDSPVSSPAAFP